MSLHFGKIPTELDSEQIHDYLFYLQKKSKSPSQSYFKHTVYGLRFLLKSEGLSYDYLSLPEIKREKKLPVVLSNVAEEVTDWSYTLESLVEADPEIIIIADDMKESFETAETYKDLTAVKNGNVFGVDKNTLERQGYRNAEGLRTLAEIIHPEAFQ